MAVTTEDAKQSVENMARLTAFLQAAGGISLAVGMGFWIGAPGILIGVGFSMTIWSSTMILWLGRN